MKSKATLAKRRRLAFARLREAGKSGRKTREYKDALKKWRVIQAAIEKRREVKWRVEYSAPQMLAALKKCLAYFHSLPESQIDPSSEAFLATDAAINAAQRKGKR